MFEFIKERIYESRAFRNPENVGVRSRRELGEIAFLMMLSLQLLSRTRFNREAVTYAAETLKYPLFDRIYLSTSDLANVIAALKNAREYLEEPDVDIPVFELKRWLRDFYTESMSITIKRSFFYKMQTRLRINDGYLIAFRRDIVDTDDLSWIQKKELAHRLYNQLRRYDYRCDVLVLLQKFLDSQEN